MSARLVSRVQRAALEKLDANGPMFLTKFRLSTRHALVKFGYIQPASVGLYRITPRGRSVLAVDRDYDRAARRKVAP